MKITMNNIFQNWAYLEYLEELLLYSKLCTEEDWWLVKSVQCTYLPTHIPLRYWYPASSNTAVKQRYALQIHRKKTACCVYTAIVFFISKLHDFLGTKAKYLYNARIYSSKRVHKRLILTKKPDSDSITKQVNIRLV